MALNLLITLIPVAAVVVIATVLLELSSRPKPRQYSRSCSSKAKSQSNHQKQERSSKAKSQSNHQKQDSNKSKCICEICGTEITDKDENLTKLRCDHQFHSNCISGHFDFQKNSSDIATCPVSRCTEKYSLS